MNANASTLLFLTFGSALLSSAQLLAEALPSYKGQIRLPVDLYTKEGTRIEKGQLDLEVKEEKGVLVRLLSKARGIRVSVVGSSASEGKAAQQSMFLLLNSVPAICYRARRNRRGASVYETGRPQYQDQIRDWKWTLRVYKSEDPNQRAGAFRSSGEAAWG